jgi:adenylate cyclase
MSATNSSRSNAPSRWWAPFEWWSRLAQRHPFVALFLVIIWPNAVWSLANLAYNHRLIVDQTCSQSQRQAFWDAVPFWSTLTWTIGMCVCACIIRPMYVYLRALEKGDPAPANLKQAAQKSVINLPLWQLLITFLLWMPGGLYFPGMICYFGGTENGCSITVQFLFSFLASALVTTFQTFVLLDRFLVVYLYPRFFGTDKPADVHKAIPVSFQVRMWLLWGAVSLGPIIVLALVAINPEDLPELTFGVVVFGVATGGLIIWVVGRDMASWLEAHVAATREIARENFAVRIAELRSDKWGLLTDSFNKMAEDLSRGRQVHETFGQFVGPEVRDEILQRYSDLGGNVQEITVMFADIRGFTRRAAGKAPEEVVELLNRFLTLAVQAIDGQGGWVNKFLGDGFMALFGTPLPRSDHADAAVAAARDLVKRLDGLNSDLQSQGQAPLKVGMGIHSGPALVGCIGAAVPLQDGRKRLRLEFTAIGETVNLTQRLEELTKTCGAMLLVSEATRRCLQRPLALTCLGPQEIRGAEQPLVVYTVGEAFLAQTS